jgi:hypothetical protein
MSFLEKPRGMALDFRRDLQIKADRRSRAAPGRHVLRLRSRASCANIDKLKAEPYVRERRGANDDPAGAGLRAPVFEFTPPLTREGLVRPPTVQRVDGVRHQEPEVLHRGTPRAP